VGDDAGLVIAEPEYYFTILSKSAPRPVPLTTLYYVLVTWRQALTLRQVRSPARPWWLIPPDQKECVDLAIDRTSWHFFFSCSAFNRFAHGN